MVTRILLLCDKGFDEKNIQMDLSKEYIMTVSYLMLAEAVLIFADPNNKMACHNLREQISSIRKESMEIPIFVFSHHYHESFICSLYETGIDLYLVLPVNPQEIIHRIKVFEKRTHGWPAYGARLEYNQMLLTQGRLERPDGKIIKMSQARYLAMQYFFMHPEQEIAKKDIVLYTCGNDDYFATRTFDIYLRDIRRFIHGTNTEIVTRPSRRYLFHKANNGIDNFHKYIDRQRDHLIA